MTDVVLEPSGGSEGFDPEVCYWCGALAFGYALLEADTHSPLASCGKLHCGYSYATHPEIVTRALDASVTLLVDTLEADGLIRAGVSLADDEGELDVTWPGVARALMLYGPELSRPASGSEPYAPAWHDDWDPSDPWDVPAGLAELGAAREQFDAIRPGSVIDTAHLAAERKRSRDSWRTDFR